jgi:hypothetical protein
VAQAKVAVVEVEVQTATHTQERLAKVVDTAEVLDQWVKEPVAQAVNGSTTILVAVQLVV